MIFNMILDKLLFKNISIIGKKLLTECNLKSPPQNIFEMNIFLNHLKKSINENDFKGVLIADILYSFVSSIEVRDRNTTSRNFEDIFASLFGYKCTDKSSRPNPKSIPEIKEMDKYCINENWKISTALSGNKREKTDLIIGKYNISLKTLKGKAYNENNELINEKVNTELNVGSFSYRALLKGILKDSEIEKLSDRKSGLGSGKQLRNTIFNRILEENKKEEFYKRLKIFFKYVYEDDMYIVLKSNYRIDFILIPNESFVDTILEVYKNYEQEFEKIFYRWENNNLRINWVTLMKYMKKLDKKYYRIEINLKNINNNKKLKTMKEYLENEIKDYLKMNIT